MKNNHVVIINGQAYDSTTGKPVQRQELSKNIKPKRSMQDIKVATKIAKTPKPRPIETKLRTIPMPKIGRLMDIAKSKSIERFPKINKPNTIEMVSHQQSADVAPTRHPLIAAVKKSIPQHRIEKPLPKTLKEIKDTAITEALNRPVAVERPPKKKLSRRSKIILIIASVFVFLVVGAYLVYLYTPSLSVKFASAQAGVDAKYPEYIPDGYGVNGLVSYADKKVTINFKANTGSTGYTISQSKSSWDSSALKDWVTQQSSGEFKTTTINGLTIFSYDCCAAWVNDGVLYKISGDARLLLSQIQKIATSL